MMAAKMDTQLKARNSYFKGLFGFKAHKNKIPTAMPMFSGMTFSMTMIFTSPSVAVTPEINMVDKKRKYFSSANVAHITAIEDCNRMF